MSTIHPYILGWKSWQGDIINIIIFIALKTSALTFIKYIFALKVLFLFERKGILRLSFKCTLKKSIDINALMFIISVSFFCMIGLFLLISTFPSNLITFGLYIYLFNYLNRGFLRSLYNLLFQVTFCKILHL